MISAKFKSSFIISVILCSSTLANPPPPSTTPSTTPPGSTGSTSSAGTGGTGGTGAGSGEGKTEKTDIKLLLCKPENPESEKNCNASFKALLLDSFHAELDMRIFGDPICLTTLPGTAGTGGAGSPTAAGATTPSGGGSTTPAGATTPSGGGPTTPSGGGPTTPSGGGPTTPSGGGPTTPSGGGPTTTGPGGSGSAAPPRRCIVQGEYKDQATNKYLPFLLHFYNEGTDPILFVLGFWGFFPNIAYSGATLNPTPKMSSGNLPVVDGNYELTNVSVILCQGDERSEKNCNPSFKTKVKESFHVDYNLVFTIDPVCRTILSSDSTTQPPTTQSGQTTIQTTGLRRCVLKGTYLDRETKKPQPFLFHCFNHGRNANVALIAYWGPRAPAVYSDGTLPPETSETTPSGASSAGTT